MNLQELAEYTLDIKRKQMEVAESWLKSYYESHSRDSPKSREWEKSYVEYRAEARILEYILNPQNQE